MKLYVFDKWKIIRYCFVLVLISFTFTVAGRITTDVISTVASTYRKLPIYNIDTTEKNISLTFDCAWGADDIDSILASLKKNNCKATFFVLGTWAEKNPEAMKKIVSAGHEIGNHSYNHTLYTTLSPEEIISDIEKCNAAIKKACGITPYLLRAPSGDYNNTVIEATHRAKMEYIQWSVDSLDWKNLNCEEMLERIIPKTQSGDILLFHNDTAHTAESLDRILSGLSEKGFTFSKVSDLIYKDNYTIDHTGRQIPSK